MRTTLSATFSLGLALALTLAAGCGDNLRDGAVLGDADTAHLRRAVDAASGADARGALAIVTELAATGDAASCPRVEVDGDTTTITGDCDGSPYVGRAILEHAGARSADDPSRVVFAQFGDGVRTIDGVVDLGTGRIHIDADVTIGGIVASTSLALSCDGVGLCAADAGSWIEVDGLGVADIWGAWRAEPRGGYLTLHAADTLTLDLNAVVNGCVPYTLDGAPAGELCD